MTSVNPFAKNYFFILSLLILALGLIAFSDNLITDVGQESNADPVFIIHGLIMYTWIVVLVIQTNRIRTLNTKAHIAFGWIGFIIGVMMILSIGFTELIRGAPWSDLPYFGKANRIFTATFAVMLVVAYLKRDKPVLHKHLIFVGMLLIMEPILSRVAGNTGNNPATLAPIIWLLLWLSMFVYDFMSRRKIHPVTYLGLLYWFGVYALVS